MPALIVSQVISSGFGFSRKRRDAAVGLGLDQAVGRRIVDRRQHDRRLGLALAMQRDDGVDVDAGHHVAVEDDERVVDALRGVANRAAGAERRRLDDVADAHAGAGAVAEHFFDAARLVVEAEDHLVDLRHLLEEIDLVVEERAIEDRHDGLGRMNRQRAEARAFAPGEQNGFHDKLPSYTTEA